MNRIQSGRQKETVSSKMDDYDENLLSAMNQDSYLNVPSGFQREGSYRFSNPNSQIR